MRTIRNSLPILLLAGLLAFVGCGKAAKDTPRNAPGMMDLPKFQQAFVSATPDQQASAVAVGSGVRYGLYPDALAALAKLDSDPALTPPQKEAVSNMVEGVKQAIAKAPAAPAR